MDSLAKLVAPERTALIVVDVQNDYCHPRGALGCAGADLAAVIDRHIDCVGHVQVADFPGRGAPGTGALPLPDLLSRLAAAGYDGYVGLEHKPAPAGSAASFPWLR